MLRPAEASPYALPAIGCHRCDIARRLLVLAAKPY